MEEAGSEWFGWWEETAAAGGAAEVQRSGEFEERHPPRGLCDWLMVKITILRTTIGTRMISLEDADMDKAPYVQHEGPCWAFECGGDSQRSAQIGKRDRMRCVEFPGVQKLAQPIKFV
jgi:hypothetical protein